MELNKGELKRLFDETLKNIDNMKESIMFNLYEDSDCYSMETTFDDEEYVICRDNPAILCSKEIDYKQVLKKIKSEIKDFVKCNKDVLKNAKEISYGFVDGDLYYIQKEKRKKKTTKFKFTADSFKDFEPIRLIMWLTVYLTDEASQKYSIPQDAENLTEEDLAKWRQILADNFNYKMYNK